MVSKYLAKTILKTQNGNNMPYYGPKIFSSCGMQRIYVENLITEVSKYFQKCSSSFMTYYNLYKDSSYSMLKWNWKKLLLFSICRLSVSALNKSLDLLLVKQNILLPISISRLSFYITSIYKGWNRLRNNHRTLTDLSTQLTKRKCPISFPFPFVGNQ